MPDATNAPGGAQLQLATLQQLDELVETATRAFLDNALFHYCADAHVPMANPESTRDRRNLIRVLHFIIKGAFLCKHRNTVIVVPKEDGSWKIVAGTLWLQPGSRLDLWKIATFIRAGVLPTLAGWGWKGFKRLALEYEPASEHAAKNAFKAKGIKQSPKQTWFLQLAWTDPNFQGKGYLSMLIRDQFAFAPDQIHMLDASGPSARDRYQHLGFEENSTMVFGRGKVGPDGIASKDKEKATGLQNFSMTRWPKA